MRYTKIDQGWAIIHKPSSFILRHYWDFRKAKQMTRYLESIGQEGDRLFDDELYQRVFRLLYEKIFVNFYVSGVRSENEISGFIFHNQSICTVAKLSKNSLQYLIEVSKDPNYTGSIFVDSGAFKEVNADLSIKKAMTDEDWNRIFDVYEVLAQAFGDRLTVMAPDRVGDQEVTMQRLEKYKDRLKKVASYGCKIMGAIQKNPTIPNSLFHFHERMDAFFRSIGIEHWVRGLPLNKSPVKIDDVEYMIQNAKPFRYIHLLGKSPYARDWDAWEGMLSKYPNLDITCDATIFRRMVGEGKALTEIEKEIRPLFKGDFKKVEEGIYEKMRKEFDQGEYADFWGWYGAEWFSHDEVKEALAEALKSSPNKYVPMPKSWLLQDNNLTKLAFLDVNLSLPFDLYDYTEQLGMTPDELDDLEANEYESTEASHLYWDTIMKLYEIKTESDDFELPYETYGTYFWGHRDGYSLFPDEYRQAIKLNELFDVVGKSVRNLAVRLLEKEDRGHKDDRLIVNRGIMKEKR